MSLVLNVTLQDSVDGGVIAYSDYFAGLVATGKDEDDAVNELIDLINVHLYFEWKYKNEHATQRNLYSSQRQKTINTSLNLAIV